MIHLLYTKATSAQLAEMLEKLETYVKVAVDVDRAILAGGGGMHADCEEVLLENGSMQTNVWGADWLPKTQQVTFESLINIRPRENNPAMTILDAELRAKVEKIVRDLLEGV